MLSNSSTVIRTATIFKKLPKETMKAAVFIGTHNYYATVNDDK